MTKNKSRTIWLVILILFLIGLFLFVGYVCYADINKRMYEKDLSSIFEINFDMSTVEIIDYEARIFGHTDYNYEYDNDTLRLRFAPCETQTGIFYKHQYFFDRETELLYYLDYKNIFGSSDKSSSICSHHDDYAQRTLKVIGDWDRTKDSIHHAYGNINGVKCEIGCFTEGIYLSKIANE